MAAHVQAQGVPVASDRIVLTASTSESYSMLFKLLCDPGDEVLVPCPSYPLFEHLTRLDGVASVPYPLEHHGRWTIDLDSLVGAISTRTRAVLVVSPNNPTGSYVSAAELEAVAAVCERHALALIGDEVFRSYPLATTDAFHPSVLEQGRALAFSLGGLSKSVGLPQVKLGWIGLGGPDALVGQALARLEVISDTYLSLSAPVQHAVATLLDDATTVRDQIADRVRHNASVLVDLTKQHPANRVLPPEGGWSAVIQVPATRSEEELVLDLLERQRVLVHPGYFFDFPREAYLVVSLLPEPGQFRQGISALLSQLDH